MWRVTGVCALLLGLLGPERAATQPSPLYEQAALVISSVARVRAWDCTDRPTARSARPQAASASSVGSGFVWRDKRSVVTALHVVAGCSRVEVTFGNSGTPFQVIAYRADPKSDLALLTLNSDAPGVPLQDRNELPPAGTEVLAMGFSGGAPTVDATRLQLTLANFPPPGSVLSAILPDEWRQKVQQDGAIRLSTRILRLDGALMPGQSGGPILAADGQVYGVVSGGLEMGTGGIQWAVRSSHLDALAAQPQSPAAPAAYTAALGFTYSIPQARLQEVTCGDAVLVQVRSSNLAALRETTDDLLGLRQLSSVLGTFASTDPDLDIWVDRVSGASIALPVDADLVADDRGCSAKVGPGLRQVIRAVRVAGPQDTQFQSLRFENDLFAFGPRIEDPLWTQPMPVFRSDGYGVRRRAYYFGNVQPPGLWADYAFLTHMTRGDMYFGVAAVRDGLVAPPPICMPGESSPSDACVAFQRRGEGWASTVLATHMSTMSPR